ncbi:hypothetical protein XI00_14110 [Bradyrhizobium sp. CCBAU 21359]|uniref:Sensor histidine kinase n=1 Tax=Bradyrhizobium arachidis TaxID=858423 RepID=A0AAE7NLC7_9BRAD|nr:hypothetical protein [Bradyrhizobium sp. CCBAU 21360]MDA9455345.1 hypothetical protein [Bradyrhizobium sp. CCBAU 21359]QOZ66421.1 sensor histidine kinase [Bradyrhizobium arachidis]SFU99681.1 hypothetical protein SAMN05192541_109112 [Bradyrhizobium arachidis]
MNKFVMAAAAAGIGSIQCTPLLAPYGSSADRLRLSGPAVELKSKQALSLAMAIHEFATNAGEAWGPFL